MQFEDEMHELNWLTAFLEQNTQYKNIGILLKQNDSFKGGYYCKRKIRKDKIYGVLELYNYLTDKGLTVSYKYKSSDKLDFSREFNVNIMTYHSSKGLQFDCVILPFSNYVNDNNGSENLPYVGLTRATHQIIITYSGLIAEEYSVLISNTTYQGKIVKKTIHDDLTDKELVNQIVSSWFPDNSNSVKSSKSDHDDISDCKVFK